MQIDGVVWRSLCRYFFWLRGKNSLNFLKRCRINGSIALCDKNLAIELRKAKALSAGTTWFSTAAAADDDDDAVGQKCPLIFVASLYQKSFFFIFIRLVPFVPIVQYGFHNGVHGLQPPLFISNRWPKVSFEQQISAKYWRMNGRIPEWQSIQAGHLIKFIFYLWFGLGFFSSYSALAFQWIIISGEFPMAVSVYLSFGNTEYVPIYRNGFCSGPARSPSAPRTLHSGKKFFILNIIWYLINRAQLDNIRWISLQPTRRR